ncbi:hypothetical protein ACKKBG_A35285 [Auxenochlorella protothecoides x Auxenochlorella symbiontica]
MLSLRTPTVVTPARLPNARPRVGFTSTRTIMPSRPRRVARAQLLSMVDESSFNLVSQVATASIWSAVAWFGYQFAMQQAQPTREGQQECSTCGGTGKVPCLCNRWSDGDVGCSTCGYSGKMPCSSCRGGGTAVPILARIPSKRD